MQRTTEAQHSDHLDEALRHFNAQFRHRYRLPAVTADALRRDVQNVDDLLADLVTARADGVVDASCALIARIVLSIVPRYAIGLLTGADHLTVLAPDEGDEGSYLGGYVLLVNPLGGRDNWKWMARWFRQRGGTNARRMLLAGLASEDRPDEAANLELFRSPASSHGRSITLPRDEAFSTERAAEVSYIYGVPAETLRAWKQRQRSELAGRRPGAPQRNR